jgi:hypothetical protein
MTETPRQRVDELTGDDCRGKFSITCIKQGSEKVVPETEVRGSIRVGESACFGAPGSSELRVTSNVVSIEKESDNVFFIETKSGSIYRVTRIAVDVSLKDVPATSSTMFQNMKKLLGW